MQPKIIYALLAALILAVALNALGLRYRMVAAGSGGDPGRIRAWVLDNWTGRMWSCDHNSQCQSVVDVTHLVR